MESVLRKAGIISNGKILTKSVQLLAYAEDIYISCIKRDVTAVSRVIERESALMCPALNRSKTKSMLSKKNAAYRMPY